MFLVRRITSTLWMVALTYEVSSVSVVCRRSPNRSQDFTTNSVALLHLIEEYGSMELGEELDEASPAAYRSCRIKGFVNKTTEDGVSAFKKAQNTLIGRYIYRN